MAYRYAKLVPGLDPSDTEVRLHGRLGNAPVRRHTPVGRVTTTPPEALPALSVKAMKSRATTSRGTGSMDDRRWSSEAMRALVVALVIAVLHGLRCIRDPYFFWHDDFQTQHLPASFEIANAWLNGEVPLLSRHSWFAGALAGEYQYGVFSPFLTICNIVVWRLGLSLPISAAFLAIVHLALVGSGAYLLGRSY